MLTFHPLTLDDKAKIDRFVAAENSRSADFNFNTFYLWDSKYRRMVADGDACIIMLRPGRGAPMFVWPIGGESATALRELLDYCAAGGFPLCFFGLEERHAETLEALYPGKFSITEDRDYEDYIYEADKLISLAGKHLHGKRNHINRFIQEHEWRFEPLERGMFPDCLTLLETWTEHTDTSAGMVGSERNAILKAFANYEALGFLGGALYAENQMIAFTFGEKICSDTFQVRFEKARGEINGAYPMVNREFVQLIRKRYPEIQYINREDDMGLENLRKSKESYYPAFLLRKFNARQKDI